VGTCPTAYLNAPFVAGTCAYAIASDSSSSYVYLTDVANSKVLGFSVASATGLLTPLAGSPYPAGNQPSAIVVDPKFPYVFVANALDGSVTTYSISSGELSRAGTFAAGIQPVAIGIDPSANHFLFTANFLGNNVSDFELSTTAGSLTNAQRSPYTANAQPTAVAAIPHGSSQK
jgi:6-phosphogluconolactonase (cycloisomerase 2 family)